MFPVSTADTRPENSAKMHYDDKYPTQEGRDLNEGWAAWTGVAALVLILWERLSRRFTWWVLCRRFRT